MGLIKEYAPIFVVISVLMAFWKTTHDDINRLESRTSQMSQALVELQAKIEADVKYIAAAPSKANENEITMPRLASAPEPRATYKDGKEIMMPELVSAQEPEMTYKDEEGTDAASDADSDSEAH